MSKLVLGAGGSVAAWKACDLVSKLVQAGHQVDVVLTEAAQRFVRPLSFSALTHRRVFTDEGWGEGTMPHDHLRLTNDAELLVIAPATANLLAKLAHGIADEILSTTYLACRCPVLVAPAMNTRMWEHPRTQANVEGLRRDGVHFVGPATGYLAEAEVGPGRLSEVPEILAAIERLLQGGARRS